MPTTPNLALPYPVPADTADVPRDIQALAVAIDGITAIRPPVVTALPGSPVDGQEIYLQTTAMATAGAIWHLRYRAAIADTSKWEFLGGATLGNGASSTYTTTGTHSTYQGNGDSQVAVPVAGIYTVTVSAWLMANASGAAVKFSPNGAGIVAADALAVFTNTPTGDALQATLSRVYRSTLTVGNLGWLIASSITGAAAVSVLNRRIEILPVRVG